MIELEGEMQVKPPIVRGQVANREGLECVVVSQQKARQKVCCRVRGDLGMRKHARVVWLIESHARVMLLTWIQIALSLSLLWVRFIWWGRK